MDRASPSPPCRADQILLGLLAATVAGVLTLFVALSLFNYPAADDFCFAAKAKQLGFLAAQEFWYQHWSGRYSLNAVWTAILSAADIVQIYRFPPMLLLIATWLSFAWLIASAFQQGLTTRGALLWGGVAAALFIAGAPDPAQTFYWLGGSITYQMANIFLLLLLGLLIRRETTARTRRSRRALFALCGLLVIAIIGANEVSLLLVGITLGGGALQAFRTGRDSRAFWTGLLLIAFIAAAISLTAPGNYQRYAGIEGIDALPRPTPWLAALLYLPWVVLRMLYWLSNLGLWASAFIVLAATFPVARARLYRDEQFDRRFLVVPLVWLAIIFGLSAIGFLINRYPLPERAESVIWLVVLLGWYPSFIVLAHFLAADRLSLPDRRWVSLATGLLIVSLLGAPTIFEGYKDVYRGYRYDQEMRQRFARLQAAADQGETDLVAESISKSPRTLFATEISTDSQNFRNQCLRDYYQVKSVRLGSTRIER